MQIGWPSDLAIKSINLLRPTGNIRSIWSQTTSVYAIAHGLHCFNFSIKDICLWSIFLLQIDIKFRKSIHFLQDLKDLFRILSHNLRLISFWASYPTLYHSGIYLDLMQYWGTSIHSSTIIFMNISHTTNKQSIKIW